MRLGLRGKMIGAASVLLGAVLVVVSAFDALADRQLLAEARRSSEGLAEAMTISVQQLGASNRPDLALLHDFMRRIGRSGIKEITVLDAEKRVVVRTDPVPHALLIEEATTPGGPEAWDLLVPIVMGPNRLGYIQLRMTSAPLVGLLDELRRDRVYIVLSIFLVAVFFVTLLSARLIRPLAALRDVAQRVAKGELDVPLPKAGHDEIGGLVGAFGEMIVRLREREALKKRLEEAERVGMLGQVAAGIAHDVRNPLNYISLGVDHLIASAPSPETRQLGERMKVEIKRASDRIGELLRLGRPLRIQPSESSLSTLLEAVGRPIESAEQPVHIDQRGEDRVYWDAAVVEDVLRNLIVNARQATNGVGPIHIAASAEGERVRVTVEDRGPGLDPGRLENLFEPWFTTKKEGVGLGLALGRKAAREHGGDLMAEAREGGGARFILILPRDARPLVAVTEST